MASGVQLLAPRRSLVLPPPSFVSRIPLLFLSARANSVFRIANSLYIQFSLSIFFFRNSSFFLSLSLSRFYRYFFPYYRGYNRAELFFFYLRTQFPLERNVFMEILREGNRLINRCKINGYNFVRLVDLVISGN